MSEDKQIVNFGKNPSTTVDFGKLCAALNKFGYSVLVKQSTIEVRHYSNTEGAPILCDIQDEKLSLSLLLELYNLSNMYHVTLYGKTKVFLHKNIAALLHDVLTLCIAKRD